MPFKENIIFWEYPKKYQTFVFTPDNDCDLVDNPTFLTVYSYNNSVVMLDKMKPFLLRQFFGTKSVPIERVFNFEHFDMRLETMHLMAPELMVQWFKWLGQFC